MLFRVEKSRQTCWGAEHLILQEAQIVRAGHSLGSTVYVELAIDVAGVDFDRALSKVEAGGDLTVGETLGDELEDL